MEGEKLVNEIAEWQDKDNVKIIQEFEIEYEADGKKRVSKTTRESMGTLEDVQTSITENADLQKKVFAQRDQLKEKLDKLGKKPELTAEMKRVQHALRRLQELEEYQKAESEYKQADEAIENLINRAQKRVMSYKSNPYLTEEERVIYD